MKLPADLPDHLRPRLLLFLSADVVGSTALKQPDRGGTRRRLRRGVRVESQERQLDLNWLVIFEAFYTRIAQASRKHWKALVLQFKDKKERNCYAGDCPVFWKTTGDEVIYYKVLTDSRQIHLVIEWWKRTIHSVRNTLDQYSLRLEEAGLDPLDVKATVWSAGFPRRNKRILDDYGLEASLVPPKRRKAVNPPLKDKGSYYDFIGPGIDIGFRIASLSSTQKMVISLDVAYILAQAFFKKGIGLEREEIYHDGRMLLKGVFEGKRYPIFWIDISREGTLDWQEVQIQTAVVPDKVTGICDKYYDEYEDYTHPPFIWNDPSLAISEVPEKFITWLKQANTEYHRLEETSLRVSQDVKNIAKEVDEIGGAARRGVVNKVAKELTEKAKSITGKAGVDGG